MTMCTGISTMIISNHKKYKIKNGIADYVYIQGAHRVNYWDDEFEGLLVGGIYDGKVLVYDITGGALDVPFGLLTYYDLKDWDIVDEYEFSTEWGDYISPECSKDIICNCDIKKLWEFGRFGHNKYCSMYGKRVYRKKTIVS